MLMSNSQEVIRFGYGSGRMDPAQISRIGIRQVEESVGRKVLGWEFYQRLLAMKASYSAAEYDNTLAYSSGAIVRYMQLYYQAQKNLTGGIPPTAENIEAGIWSTAPKFDQSSGCGQLANELWEIYLGPYIANKIQLQVAPISTYKLGANGVSFATPEAAEVVDFGGLRNFQNTLDNSVKELLENMDAFILRHDGACFSEYLGKTISTNKKRSKKPTRHWTHQLWR